MFDRIALNLQIADPELIKNTIDRFKLEKSETSNVYTNRRVKDLSHFGITVKYNDTKKENFQFIFSAHKFWNLRNGKGYQSINDFSFKDFKSAYYEFIEYVSIDNLDKAIVWNLETGVNFFSAIEYDFYASKLKGILIHGKLNEILDDRYLNNSCLFGTRQTKFKRIVFVFYDKSKETRAKEPSMNDTIPNNILRFEKRKYRMTGVIFSDLINKEFQQKTKSKLINDIKGLLWIDKISIELKTYLDFCNLGLEYLMNKNEIERKYESISIRTYYRQKDILKNIETYKPPQVDKDWKLYFDDKIYKKIEIL